MLELVQLEGKSDRRPRELSGGQQQRVALARALVNRPRALLLDEPLAALDLKLRQAMQVELKRIQREVGITFVFVTHDQNEALTMSDRLVVMNAGRIEQLGAPRDVYERPRTRFVAGFIGTSNLISGTRPLDGRQHRGARDAAPDESLVVPDAVDAGATVGPAAGPHRPPGEDRDRRRTPGRRAGARSAAGSPRSSTSAPPRSTRCDRATEPSCSVFVQNASDSERHRRTRRGRLAVLAAGALAARSPRSRVRRRLPASDEDEPNCMTDHDRCPPTCCAA